MLSNQNKEDLYLSFDIESDGPTPLINNLLSIGIVGITMSENIIFEFEANIEPLPDHIPDQKCMDNFWLNPEQKIAWDHLQNNKRDYNIVFKELSNNLNKLSEKYQIHFVAHPACFDWMFFKYYYERAKLNSSVEESFYDIGYKCICSSTLWDYYKKSNELKSSEADKLFKQLGDYDKNSDHMACSDARVQGKFYIRLLKLLANNK